MHELALVQRILDICLKVSQTHNVKTIVEIYLEIGDFSLVIESMLERSFEILKKNTPAENAHLVIKRTPGVIMCDKCGKESEIWFNEVKEAGTTTDPNQQQALDTYEKTITPENAMSGNTDFGRNLFKCRHCGANDTNLIKGKSLLIKNLKAI